MTDLGTQAFASNKPTHYILDHGDFNVGKLEKKNYNLSLTKREDFNGQINWFSLL